MRYQELLEAAEPKMGSQTSALKDGRTLKLTLEPNPNYEGFDVSAEVDGEYCGSLTLSHGRHDKAVWSATNVNVNKEFQRLGIATAMYNFAFKSGVKPIVPDTKLSPDGSAFWDKHLRTGRRPDPKKGPFAYISPKREWNPKFTVKEDAGNLSITDAILQAKKGYNDRGLSDWQIGDGYCSDFARDVWNLMGQPRDVQDVETNNFARYDRNDDPVDWDWKLLAAHWGITPPKGHSRKKLKQIILNGAMHVWLTKDGRHYDAETPNGVASFFELPFFRRWLGELTEEVISEIAIVPDHRSDSFGEKLSDLGERIGNMIRIGSIDTFDAYATVWPIHDRGTILVTDNWGNPAAYLSTFKGDLQTHVISMVYVDAKYRNKGLSLGLYKLLLDKGLTLMSDVDQVEATKSNWQKLAAEPGIQIGLYRVGEKIKPITDLSLAYRPGYQLVARKK